MFACGAAVLSGALAAATYGIVHHYLLNQREGLATAETFTNAKVVERDLENAGTNIGQALSSLTQATGTVSLLYRGGKWFSASVAVGEASSAARPAGLTPALVSMVAGGQPARERVLVQGQPAVAVGVPLRADRSDYFEIHSLSELSGTFEVLAAALFGCALATTAGGLLVGRWASGRLVRPLRAITDVAAAIAGGAVDKRLPPASDPDLAVLATSFNEMVEALEARMKRDARFASDVSHELRSPLTTVQASVDLLEASKASLPPDGRRALELLGSEVRRFSAMVQDLLEMSRSDAGAHLDLEEVDLGELVANTVATYTSGSVPVAVGDHARGLWVSADPRRLQRVLVNLLDTARAHAGGALGVRVDRRDGWAEVAVDDCGPGVPPAEQAAIFERFYRGAAAGRRADGSGTGLGLALVADHVRAHHGSVWVESRPGGGSSFVIRLPLLPGAGGQPETATPARGRA
jgi:two-component system sensor histidine kinase MtrB